MASMTREKDSEILQALQSTINLLINQQESQKKINVVKEVEIYKRDNANLITCKEAARIYPIGEQKFRELCRSRNKSFPSIKIGCRHYIVKNKLDEWFMENAIGGAF